jgi:hypothetical protein
MVNKWLLRLSYDNPQLANSDPVRFEFENDKNRMDDFFESYGYSILRVDVNNKKSYRIPNKNIYVLSKNFFDSLIDSKNISNNIKDNDKEAVKKYLIEAYDRILMTLRCIKDLVQEIGEAFYINPHTFRLKNLFELLDYKVISKEKICEGGLFLKGVPEDGDPFLIVSHDFIDDFEDLNTTILRSPKNIGTDPLDSHIDLYLGIINFKEKLEINGTKFNGILYIHKETLKIIQNDPLKQDQWNILKEEIEKRGYVIRIYIPETSAQNIGINFKYDGINKTLITNAFPSKERKFLKNLRISVLAPEYNFSTNDSFSGGINCSYIFIPNGRILEDKIINWIIDHK